MSWSLSAQGTVAAVKRMLGEQKIWGSPSPEEQASFDAARAQLTAYADGIERGNPGNASGDCVTLVNVAASGHGACATSIACSYSLAWLK